MQQLSIEQGRIACSVPTVTPRNRRPIMRKPSARDEGDCIVGFVGSCALYSSQMALRVSSDYTLNENHSRPRNIFCLRLLRVRDRGCARSPERGRGAHAFQCLITSTSQRFPCNHRRRQEKGTRAQRMCRPYPTSQKVLSDVVIARIEDQIRQNIHAVTEAEQKQVANG